MNEQLQDAGTDPAQVMTEPAGSEVRDGERARTVHNKSALHRGGHDRAADLRSVTWMRISDAVAMSSGKVTGRGLNLEAALVRSIRRQPAVTRRAISERTHRLATLSSFGGGRRTHSVGRAAMDRG